MIKRSFLLTLLLLTVIFLKQDAKVQAYTKDAVSIEQLQHLMSQFRTENSSHTLLENKEMFYMAYFTGIGYRFVVTSNPFILLHPYVFSSYQVRPSLWHSGLYYRVADIIFTNNIPVLELSGVSNSGYGLMDYIDSGYFMTYSDYPIKHSSSLDGKSSFLRSKILWGEEYRLNKYLPDFVYDKNIPTPTNLRFKFILPSGIFSIIKPREMQISWTPSAVEYNVEIQLGYNVTVNKEKHSRTVMFKTIDDNILSSLGTYKWENDVVESFLRTQPNCADTTFGNGKLSLTHVYVRYCKGLQYGNWVKINTVTGDSEIDKGNIVSEYEEVYFDGDEEIKVDKDTEYNGIKIDTDGNKVDPKTMNSFSDYLLGIPNIMASLFSGLISLLTMSGKFGEVFGSLFSFLPPEATSLIVVGIGTVIVIGIIKVLK